ncbi:MULTISPECIES: very short patch repair endonuclease [unclassified Massilia]|uniref:very short patch repair endonuclease n=1 Tax=unclassified Massilia TaxID=2609279 RepID=UPI00177BFB89|nr:MULTISPECIES: very short patch repair endonuclease [unclassified Massilia]MBD8532100.1 DNA mismatch endonuclease Vsr [Massilia sp. CFBP 13647]MBD8675546.1 DNA mismatch endonuclease Vsr [Massilia sp. CFBP 13721]
MVDSISAAMRSDIMSRVRSKGTRPEMLVRRMIHGAGFRYRLHVRGLPGSPDLVFSGRRKVIFVHGCFWHSHPACQHARIPKSRVDFWMAKLSANKARDERNVHALVDAGWRVMVLWECELRDPELMTRIGEFLS